MISFKTTFRFEGCLFDNYLHGDVHARADNVYSLVADPDINATSKYYAFCCTNACGIIPDNNYNERVDQNC